MTGSCCFGGCWYTKEEAGKWSYMYIFSKNLCNSKISERRNFQSLFSPLFPQFAFFGGKRRGGGARPLFNFELTSFTMKSGEKEAIWCRRFFLNDLVWWRWKLACVYFIVRYFVGFFKKKKRDPLTRVFFSHCSLLFGGRGGKGLELCFWVNFDLNGTIGKEVSKESEVELLDS